jgi:predicted Zn-dependent protease
MRLPTHPIAHVAACLLALLSGAGCSNSDTQARDALADYQAAAAANDPLQAQRALLKLVSAKEDVPDYWVELGKIQASLGRFGDAYYALTRAYELDRSNPELLRALTEIAVRSGDLGLAQTHARQLEIVAPGDRWVKIVSGLSAIKESRFDEALLTGEKLLTANPYDPAGTIIKARALVGLERSEQAEQILTEQVRAQPQDIGSLQMLQRIYIRRGDWLKVLEAARRTQANSPGDSGNALLLIEAAFRSGNVAEGRSVSLDVLRKNASPTLISGILETWSNHWASPDRVSLARALGNAAPTDEQRLLYAAFLNRAGDPADGARLSASSATLPVSAKSAEANAVYANALWRLGKLAEAKSRLDAVIAFDPGNATALRGRAELLLKTGRARAAVIDAQKLVTVLPNSAPDRLLLARSYVAAGNSRWAERTLWTAFQDIEADRSIFVALAATKKGDAEALRELQAEFVRQRDAKLTRGLL